MTEVDVIIEIPVNSNLKLELDKKINRMRLDRVLTTSMNYPGNYGFVPNTLADDGDALDALIPVDYPLPINCIVKCRIVGVLLMKDESGVDAKLIVYPTDKIDRRFSHITKINEVSKFTLEKIAHFFNNYKALSPGKFTKLNGFRSVKEANQILEESIRMYQNS